MAQITHSGRLATELRSELARRKISAPYLAEQIGISQSAMWRKLNAKSEFSLDEVVAIAHALDIAITDLIAMADTNGSAA